MIAGIICVLVWAAVFVGAVEYLEMHPELTEGNEIVLALAVFYWPVVLPICLLSIGGGYVFSHLEDWFAALHSPIVDRLLPEPGEPIV